MDNRQEIARHFPALLQRWDGSNAKLLQLTHSHQSLTVLLQKSSSTGNLLIACVGPTFICSPVAWEHSHIAIEINKDGPGFVVFDIHAGARIITDHVELRENVKKPWK